MLSGYSHCYKEFCQGFLNDHFVILSCSSDHSVLYYGRQEEYTTSAIYLEKFLRTGQLASLSIYSTGP